MHTVIEKKQKYFLKAGEKKKKERKEIESDKEKVLDESAPWQ